MRMVLALFLLLIMTSCGSKTPQCNVFTEWWKTECQPRP